MDRVIKYLSSQKGDGGILLLMFMLVLIGLVTINTVFDIGITKYSRHKLQKIVGLAVNRAALEIDISTDDKARNVGTGIKMDGSKTDSLLSIDKVKAKAKFLEVFKDNTGDDLKDEEVLLLTPINILSNGNYEFFLEGLDDGVREEAGSIDEVSLKIQTYLYSKTGKAYSLNFNNKNKENSIYVAVLEYDAGITSDGSFVLKSFSGSQVFRKYD